MPDIREVLNALEEKDRHLYSHLRTTARNEYLQAVHEVIGIRNYSIDDDAFMDLIDIKIATLFDRAGKFNNAKGSIDEDAAIKIEQDITKKAAGITVVSMTASQRKLEEFAPKQASWGNNVLG